MSESKPEKCTLIWPKGGDGMHRRTLLEVALACGNFKLEMAAPNNDALNDPAVIRKAVQRASEYIHGPLRAEVDLREKWRIEDDAGDRPTDTEGAHSSRDVNEASERGEG